MRRFALKKGDVIRVDFTARELLNHTVFDSTIEEDAKKFGVFNPRAVYKPVPIVLGKGDFFPAVEKVLEEMNVGEEKTVELESSEAFGERNAKNIVLLSLQEFKKQQLRPIPGLVVEADGRQGKVQSVSGGRVRVDFNHPLAGKKVSYRLIVREKIEQKEEQVAALLEKFFPHVKKEERVVKLDGKQVEIELPKPLNEQRETELLKQLVARVLPEQLEGIEGVVFVEKKEKTENPIPAKN